MSIVQNEYHKCEAKITDWTNLNNIKRSICQKTASFTCIHCNKHFCMNCMYLLCNVCYEYLVCFTCGITHVKTNGTHYLDSKQYCTRCLYN